MTDIPADIAKTARTLTEDYRERYDDVRASTSITDVWGIEDQMHTDAIARAILAERERCADVVRDYLMIPFTNFGSRPDELASAIRSPERAGE